jgi:hypothetical protein
MLGGEWVKCGALDGWASMAARDWVPTEIKNPSVKGHKDEFTSAEERVYLPLPANR